MIYQSEKENGTLEKLSIDNTATYQALLHHDSILILDRRIAALNIIARERAEKLRNIYYIMALDRRFDHLTNQLRA